MIKLFDNGAYLLNGTELVEDNVDANAILTQKLGTAPSKEEAAKNTMAYGILEKHNTSDNMDNLKIKFDKMTSHDITFVGIIQTARASGLKEFPIPYVLTNCHNSLCAVGGTINEDDHMFGLSCAKKFGGVYVPPHQAVIHQFAREMLAECGAMILGSDSHTRYGALGTMAIGEGGGELAKQLLCRTYDVAKPGVVAIYLDGEVAKGVGPQDVALAIIGATFQCGYVKNKVMEFVGPGVDKLSADFRIGIDVMTTETTCLSSIWKTDEKIKEWYDTHYRPEAYKEMNPGSVAYYDGVVYVDLSKVKPMIAMPFHPSNTYTIEELNANLMDILDDCEKRAQVSFDGKVDLDLKSKVKNGRLYVDQGIIAGCAGGGFENICDAADILKGSSIGADEFTLSVYPASTPIYMELVKNGAVANLLETGAIVKTAFCGPCFGAGDTPANNALSIRHSTRNFPNREGSKIQNGQISSVALMDARSIAATAANKGYLTAATDLDVEYKGQKYFFDKSIYDRRVYNGVGKADPSVEIKFGPNIKDWPEMVGNIIPFIGGEEEKSEKEPLRLWGYVDDEKKQIVPAESPVITCQCIRVPVLNGHTAAVFVKFRKKPTKEQLIEALEKFSGVPQELGLPSAPKQFIRYCEEDNRPQVALDVDYEHGMGINVGRLREDTVYDWKFVGLSHNTVRGAAGGAVLCAELLKAQGYITKK